MAYKHLDFLEIESRLSPNRATSVRGKRYEMTTPGHSDITLLGVVNALKSMWTESPDKTVRLPNIEQSRTFTELGLGNFTYLIPAALKRLAKMKQVKIDFDAQGAWCSKGKNWIET